MRIKFPQILCYNDWRTLWSLPDKDTTILPDESERLKELRNTVIALLEKHKNTLLEVEESMVKYAQEYTISNPPLYTAKIKDARTKIVYQTVKTFWPMVGGKKKEIRIYMGKPDDFEVPPFKSKLAGSVSKKLEKFNNQKMLKEFIKLKAKEMIQNTLKERRESGEI